MATGRNTKGVWVRAPGQRPASPVPRIDVEQCRESDSIYIGEFDAIELAESTIRELERTDDMPRDRLEYIGGRTYAEATAEKMETLQFELLSLDADARAYRTQGKTADAAEIERRVARVRDRINKLRNR
jgi:two-component SAPR family response regulator